MHAVYGQSWERRAAGASRDAGRQGTKGWIGVGRRDCERERRVEGLINGNVGY